MDDREKKREKDHQILGLDYESIFPKDQPQLRWSTFSAMDPEEMFTVVTQEVFPFMKSLGVENSSYSKYIQDAIFVIPTPTFLSRIIAGINDLPKVTRADANVDTLSDL